MGFGFNLFVLFILIPLSLVLALLWNISGKRFFGKALGLLWGGLIGLILAGLVIRPFTEKIDLAQEDIYGDYVIDRTKFPGKQADWQYNHFRFTLNRDNEFIFYQTEQEKILKVTRGTFSFLNGYRRPRIVLQVAEPRHHIIEDTPTLYRAIWSFYYVFHSPEFGNVFFTKAKWKPLESK
ncbi:hypothetical protein [Hymenobacter sp. BT730]|uniref:hypothetical protein n=1 Tax=Hymenobacter sp. BT730 TaxID=3063332 RepID=UPI0026DFE85A|nr:hypothetical protein [Hymenobacter sp. BT730]